LILTPRRMDGEMFEHKPERVLDYFVVVGLDENIVELQDEPFACYGDSFRGAPDPATAAKSATGAEGYDSALHRVLHTRYRAAVLDRFPTEDHPDTALPPQIAMFALPEGLTVKVRASTHARTIDRSPRGGDFVEETLCAGYVSAPDFLHRGLYEQRGQKTVRLGAHLPRWAGS
jgi:hypothetical protein